MRDSAYSRNGKVTVLNLSHADERRTPRTDSFARRKPSTRRIQYGMVAVWVLLLLGCFYVHSFRAGLVEGELRRAFSLSAILGYGLYLLLGCFRGFTLIPAANLLLVGIFLIPPLPLFVLTVVGILVSSGCIYWFSESLGLDEYFERTQPSHFRKCKESLQKHELAIITTWSFCPFAPTDAVCYLCGVLKIDFFKTIVGILIGEGTICAVYIFVGQQALRWLHLRP